MSVSICPLHPVFVGEVAGVDCRRPLGREEVAAIDAGMDEYAVLVFRDQPFADDCASVGSADTGDHPDRLGCRTPPCIGRKAFGRGRHARRPHLTASSALDFVHRA